MVENTIYYSRHCQHCKNFILQLKRNNILNYFTKKICVDDPQIRRRLPKYIKEVPTIITNDHTDQSNNPIPLASDMAFKWIIFKVKDNEQQKQQQINRQQKQDTKSVVCVPGAMDCYGDNFGGLSQVGDNLKPECKLDGDGKSINTSINYEAFNLINPNHLNVGRDGKTVSTEINYDAFNITGGADLKAQAQSSGGSFDSDLEKLQKMRELDNTLYGNNGKARQG